MRSVPAYVQAGIGVIDMMIQEMGWDHEEMGNAHRWERIKDRYRFYAVRFHLVRNPDIVMAIPTHLIAVEIHNEQPTDWTNPSRYFAEAEVWHIDSYRTSKPKILRSCRYICNSTRPIPITDIEHRRRTGRLLPSDHYQVVKGLRPNRLA